MNPVGLNSVYSSYLNYANVRPNPLPGSATDPLAQAGGAGAIADPSQTQAALPFSGVLGKFVGEVNAKQTTAADAVSGMLAGQNVPLHQAMVSMEEANVSFQLMVQVRNKLLDGYQELMRLQV